jgi:hypothetical protein
MLKSAQLPQAGTSTPTPATSTSPPHEQITTRRALLFLSVALSFSYAVFNSIYLGRPEKRVTWETVFLGFALTVIFSAYEYFRANLSETSFAAEWMPRLSESRKMVALSLASLGIILVFASSNPAPHVYAAALDWRLKSLTRSPRALDPGNVDKIISAVTAASESGLKIHPKVLDAATNTVVEAAQLDSSVWPSALGIMAYRSSQNPAVKSTLTTKTCFPASDSSKITMRFAKLSIVGCPQQLDGIGWSDVAFENSTIIYRGGATKLERVEFKNCRFAIDYTPRGQELAKALASSNVVTINLADH